MFFQYLKNAFTEKFIKVTATQNKALPATLLKKRLLRFLRTIFHRTPLRDCSFDKIKQAVYKRMRRGTEILRCFKTLIPEGN